jgi:hypothetical protein
MLDKTNNKPAKLDMVVLMMEMVGRLKIRWEVTNPGVDKVLDRVVGWAEVNADLRISLWLAIYKNR